MPEVNRESPTVSKEGDGWFKRKGVRGETDPFLD